MQSVLLRVRKDILEVITAKQELLELKYLGNLAADIAAWLEAGVTWREIRDRVKEATGVSVVHETLRHWYGPRNAA